MSRALDRHPRPTGSEATAPVALEDAPVLTVLFLSPDTAQRRDGCAALDSAGYRTVGAADWLEADTVVAEGTRENPVSLIVLDDRIARDAAVRSEAQEVARRSLKARALHDGIPLLLLVDLLDPVDYPGFGTLAAADWVAKPLVAVELARRAETLIARTALALARRNRAMELRRSVRAISAAIRETDDPRAMATTLVTGLADTFQAQHVWFTTVPEHDLPRSTMGLPRESRDLGVTDDHATALATRLWDEESILVVTDFPANLPEDAEAWLAEWASDRGFTAFAAIPVGDPWSVLGVILLGDSRGPRRWTSLDTSLITYVAQNLAHELRRARLIAGQKQVLARLKELDRTKSDLMATVNHELRTPLTSIVGYLELVEDGDGGEIPAGAAAMLRVVGHNVVRLQGMVDDMLTMSRLEANVAPPARVPVRLDLLLTRVVESIRPVAASRSVRLEVEDAGFAPVVLGDAMQLERALTNLTDNSVKFTPAAGSVRVGLERGATDAGEPTVVVRISDTGIGIPADDLPRLFTRFFRASNATTAAIPGTGLGLAIVQSLIEAHDGEIGVTSTVGVGTTFLVTLPLSAVASSATPVVSAV